MAANTSQKQLNNINSIMIGGDGGQEDSGVMTLDDFKRWKVGPLKEYLRKRGLKVAGRKKEELVSLAFGAHQLKKSPVVSYEESMRERAIQYRALLSTPHGQMPDPFSELQSGWLNEDQGMKMWPPTMQFDIAEFLLRHCGDKDLNKRLLSDYKEGKAFSYFSSNFLDEVFVHIISDNSKYCFLKSKSTPSQSVTAVAHTIWILVEKKTGRVENAYCTCFAGLGSTCNHVAAVLFKVEHAWSKGWTNPACTSRPCEWNRFGEKGSIEPKRLKEMDIKKPHYKKKGQGQSVNPPARQLFVPTDSERLKQTAPLTLQEIMSKMYSSCKNACVFQYVQVPEPPQYSVSSDINVAKEVEVNTSARVPYPITQLATKAQTTQEFLQTLPTYSPAEVKALEEATRGQASNPVWKEHRAGLITASNIHSVWTKVITLKSISSGRSKDTANLVKRLCSADSKFSYSIASLKYGRQTEPEARHAYVNVLKGKGHKNISVKEVGLCILGEQVYLGASPDGFVRCSCCGDGLLEIKCPLSIAHEDPNQSKLEYLKQGKNQQDKHLNKSHTYYSQIVTQMAVTNRKWCDLFIYTKHGFYIERLVHDQGRWIELMLAAKTFFVEYITPFLISQELMPVKPGTPTVATPLVPVTSVSTPSVTFQPVSCPGTSMYISKKSVCETPPLPSLTRHRQQRSNKRKPQSKPVYVCSSCGLICKDPEDMMGGDDNSVCCDKCNNWFHWGCVGFSDELDEWMCQECDTVL